MLKHQNIIKIEFFEPIGGSTEFYFGSKEAAFERFSEDQLGISKNALRATPIKKVRRKVTTTCIIESHRLERHSKEKKTNNE